MVRRHKNDKRRHLKKTDSSGELTPIGRDRRKLWTAKSDILYGYHSVYEALKAGRRQFESLVCSPRRCDPRMEKITALAGKKRIAVNVASMVELDEMAGGGNHQGICAVVSQFPMTPAGDIWSILEKRREKGNDPFFVLLLESIEDPHNMGALIRTGLCAGVDYIVIPKDRSAQPSAGVSRSSAGAMEHANIFVATNLAAFMRELKASGAWISGLDAGGKKSVFEAELTGDLALVVGGEHKGLRPGVRKECDFILSIPILGGVNSLNASVAGGIAMYEARRQRGWGGFGFKA
ncbi:MAG: 23S rRNA (guanosine(2251)-2'-O)-methyltransferase RlmB [Desulfobacterales bacterium]|nr:MAG: 23S rRNA (guanosine(2251)-2'-O)-methyltransferase RlmB [Desulfobacterales bacterium]